jgi:hypothetical protein
VEKVWAAIGEMRALQVELRSVHLEIEEAMQARNASRVAELRARASQILIKIEDSFNAAEAELSKYAPPGNA